MEAVMQEELGIARAQLSLGRTDAAVFISGWVPGNKSAEITGVLKEVTGDHCVIEMVEPGEDRRGTDTS